MEFSFKMAKTTAQGMMDDYEMYWKAHHMEINKYVFPRRGRFFDVDNMDTRGNKRYNDIVHTAAVLCNNKLSAGLQAGLTSEASKWFKAKIANDYPYKDYNDDPEVAEWTETVEDILYRIYSGSNFYTAEYEGFSELGAYCTSCMYVEEDYDDVAWFKIITVGQYFIRVDRKGRVDALCRSFYMRYDELVKEYGEENVSNAVKNDYKAKTPKKKKFQIIHLVMENPDYQKDNLMAKRKKWRSITYELKSQDMKNNGTEKFLRDSGYDMFPFIVSRWSTVGEEDWGSGGPGIDSLALVKALQKLDERGYKSLDRWLRPPLNVPASMAERGLSLHPDAINYFTSEQMKGGAYPIYTVQPAFRELSLKEETLIKLIEQHYYNDIFTAFLDNIDQKKTAYEASKIEQEKLNSLGSVVSRFNKEHIEEVIKLTFYIAEKRGAIPPPPKSLPPGFRIEIEHISPLASAQKAKGTRGIEAFAEFTLALAKIDQKSVFKMDVFESLDKYNELIVAPVKVKRNNEKAMEMYNEFLQAQQQAMQMQTIKDQAAATKDLSEARTGTDSVLDQMLEGVR